MIIKPKPLNVQQDPSAKSAVPFIKPAIMKARAESVLEKEDVLPPSFLDGEPMMAKQLKQYISFRALMEADGHQIQTSGKYLKCCCPFHADKTPSFVIHEDDTRAKCYGCNWYGDIFKYEMDFHHVDFKQAWKSLNAFLRQEPRIARKAKVGPKKVVVEEPSFTPRQLEERKRYAARLADEAWLAEEVCRKRFERSDERWDPNIIQNLAREGSLGWADCLAFIYPTGTKYRRWPEKELIWEGTTSLWRGHLIGTATHVYLTESETDAIALIHTGLEQTKPGHVVVAAPSATTFKKEWAPPFQDKVVVFCYDNDGAGEKGVQDVAPLVAPYAKEVRFLNWKEVA